MRSILFLLIIALTSVVNADNRIKSDNLIVLIVNKSEDCRLSRRAEQLFLDSQVSNTVRTQHQQVFKYYAQDHLEYVKSLGVKHLPMVYKFKRVNGKWYQSQVFDPGKRLLNLSNLIRFLKPPRMIRVAPPST